MAQKFTDIDDYLASLPEGVRDVVQQVRQTIHAAVPGSEETISYHMPTMLREGRRYVHFSGWAKHIALYPAPEGDAHLVAALQPYASGQGTLRFRLDRPVPYALIGRAAAALAAGLTADHQG